MPVHNKDNKNRGNYNLEDFYNAPFSGLGGITDYYTAHGRPSNTPMGHPTSSSSSSALGSGADFSQYQQNWEDYSLDYNPNLTAEQVEKQTADFLMSEWEKQAKITGPLENWIMDMDLDLVGKVPGIVDREAKKQQGIQKRNISRYGATLTPMEQKERDRANQRGRQKAEAGATTEAALEEVELKKARLYAMLNINAPSYNQAIHGATDMGNLANQQLMAWQQAKTRNKQISSDLLTDLISIGASIWGSS